MKTKRHKLPSLTHPELYPELIGAMRAVKRVSPQLEQVALAHEAYYLLWDMMSEFTSEFFKQYIVIGRR